MSIPVSLRYAISVTAVTVFLLCVGGAFVMVDKKKNLPDYSSDPDEIMEMMKQAYEEIKASKAKRGQETRPPWEVITDTPWPSIAWRMGGGEDVMHEFFEYFSSLNTETRALYIKQNPEPVDWEGFYDMVNKSYLKE